MNKFAIIGDSTCDLTTEQRHKYNIDYARMLVSWTDNKGNYVERHADLDWKEYSVKEFYDILRSGIRIITSQVTEQEFDDAFLPHLEKGEDILYIACSSGLSAGIHLAERLIRDKYSKIYPNQKIIIVDSLISAMGQGLMLIYAAEKRNEGKTIEEIADYLNKNRLCYLQVATVESLEYLRRAGRVKASAAFFGNILGVKPMLVSDIKGINHAVEKVKGRRSSLIRCAEMIRDTVIDAEHQTIYVEHADARQEDIDLVVNKIKEFCNFKEIVVQNLGPIIGCSTGPGTFGIYYFGKEETVCGD